MKPGGTQWRHLTLLRSGCPIRYLNAPYNSDRRPDDYPKRGAGTGFRGALGGIGAVGGFAMMIGGDT